MPSAAPGLHGFPAVHALDVVELCAALGVAEHTLLEGSALTREALAAPDARVSLGEAEALVARAIALTGQRALGLLLGMRMRVPAHGFLGFAAMTAPTVRHALQLAVRYAPTRTDALSLRLEEREEEALLAIDEHADLGAARETVLFALIVGLWQIGEKLTAHKLVGRAELALAQASFRISLENTPFSVRFGAPGNVLVFARSYLDLPLAMAEPSASKLAEAQCERALEALDRTRLLLRVRDALGQPGGGVRTVDDVAAALGISARTLHRKLKAEGVVFSEVVDDVQRREAEALLADPRLSIEAIAERVGYSDVSNFSRAFKRWTGSTPAAYRRTVSG